LFRKSIPIEKRSRAIFFTDRTFAEEAVIWKGCPGFFHQSQFD